MSARREEDLAVREIEKFAIGQPVARTEDPRLLRGEGRFTDDLEMPGAAQAFVLRSPFAHARIDGLDTTRAVAAPGVLAILTARDLAAAGFGTLKNKIPLQGRDGAPMREPPRPSLATDRVRYQGEPIALVVAETLAQARDAAELIELEATPLAAVTDARAAGRPDAPRLHEDVPGNLCLDWESGDCARVDAAFARAAHVARLEIENNRIIINPLEPRAAVAEYDSTGDRFTLHLGSQGVFGLRNNIAGDILRIEKERLRVRTYDVGGSFGMKSAPYPEYGPLLLAARRLGRPVRWRDERADSFLADQHGRASMVEASMAFDAEGHVLAARVIGHANVGAYPSQVGPMMGTRNILRNFPSLYRLPLLHIRTYCRFTNTGPIAAYRGAGRPESNYYVERLMDTAAREMGIDRIELRRRNLLRPDEIPHTAVSGLTYDSGDFPAVLADALERADWNGFPARRADSVSRGKLRGQGLACYLEATGAPSPEMAAIRFDADGGVTITSGTQNQGQGHAASFAQILSSRLAIPFHSIRLEQGDSDSLLAGGGTGGSKTMITGGGAILEAADAVIELGRHLAARVLEAAVEDIGFEAGAFRILGTDRALSVMALAQALGEGGGGPDQGRDALDVALSHEAAPSSFPNGCHVAEVEIDPETGVVAVTRYVVVDDFGVLINPMLVEGQVQGGIAQGIGQALMERTCFDATGQLTTGSFMDYALPRALDVPAIAFHDHPVPATSNPLGVKGCGEAGCSGALGAVMNAVVDALSSRGIHHIDMPATPARVWAALQGGGAVY